MLSAENIWQNIPRASTVDFEEAKKVQEEFLDKDGDHMTLIKVYQQWKTENSSQDWAFDHYLNQRSLSQAADIRQQLKQIMRRVRDSALQENRIFEEFKTSVTSISSRVRFCLCMGFYMNAARAIAYGQEGSYLSVKDGTMLHVDKFTSIAVLQAYPKWIVYTQLSGNTLSHGTIKILSRVKGIWLEKLVTKLEGVNMNKLMGVPEAGKREREENSKEETKESESKEQIVEQARLRYLKRKLNS